MKAEHVVSYRLTDAEIQALEALRLPGEKSVSITAKRLLHERLGLSTLSTNIPLVDNVDKIVDSSKLESKLEEKLASLVSTINQRLEALEKLKA